jgi:uncharacterized protein YneR
MNLALASIFVLLFCSSAAQVPQGINYQALARDASNNPIASQTIQVRLTVLSSLAPEVIQWEELHSSVLTNANGLFTLVLGSGARQITSAVTLFSDIDWNVPEIYLRTHVTYESLEHLMGTSRLMAVPYALTAGDISGSLKKLNVLGETAVMDEPLFEVKNKDNKTVFAVYNEGVRVYVDDGASKAVKGGFAIGSFDEVKGYQEYFVVNSDCVRVYIDENPGKAVKGGFAIGSFDETKAGVQDYLKVSGDSIRFYVSDDPSKAVKGGFAIGSFDETKGPVGSFTTLTSENYLIGHNSGTQMLGGKYNSFFGYEAGMSNINGSNNVFLGFSSGRTNSSGQSNVFLGNLAGYSNISGSNNVMLGDSAGYNSKSSFNVFLGRSAGRTNNNGSSNTFIGYRSGMNNSSGSNNVFLGNLSGFTNSSGAENIFIGSSAGYSNTLGRDNVIMGNSAGMSNTEGCYNLFLGFYAGKNNIGSGPAGFPGNYNVFMGYMAGRDNQTGQSNVYIANMAGAKNTSGSFNTFIGRNSGGQMTSGDFNLFLGGQAAEFKTGGNYNVILGPGAGANSTTGSMNVFIGKDAGRDAVGSGLLYIENSDSEVPLIGGDFTNDRLAINGKPVSATFEVNGTFRMGNQGSDLTSIIKATVSKDLPSIAANTSYNETFAVSNAVAGSSVMISPSIDLTDGLVIAFSRVSASGEVTVCFRNTKDNPVDNPAMNWYITIVR